MDFINQVFKPYLDSFAIVHIDDILVCSISNEKHEAQLYIVVRMLKEKQIYAKQCKCEF